MTSPKSPAVSIIIHKVKRVLLLAVLLLQGHPLYSTVYVLSFSLNYNYMYHCDHKNYPLRHILHGSSSSGSGSGSGSPRRTRRFYSSSSSPSAVTATTTTATNSATSTITIDLPFTEYYTPPATEATATATEATTTTTTISTGTPVLLLHGLLGSKRNFASLATSLGNQLEVKRRILGVDLRNHGK